MVVYSWYTMLQSKKNTQNINNNHFYQPPWTLILGISKSFIWFAGHKSIKAATWQEQRPVHCRSPSVCLDCRVDFKGFFTHTLRILGMSWGLKITCFEAPGVSLGGSGVSIGGVRILRVASIYGIFTVPTFGYDKMRN